MNFHGVTIPRGVPSSFLASCRRCCSPDGQAGAVGRLGGVDWPGHLDPGWLFTTGACASATSHRDGKSAGGETSSSGTNMRDIWNHPNQSICRRKSAANWWRLHSMKEPLLKKERCSLSSTTGRSRRSWRLAGQTFPRPRRRRPWPTCNFSARRVCTRSSRFRTRTMTTRWRISNRRRHGPGRPRRRSRPLN